MKLFDRVGVCVAAAMLLASAACRAEEEEFGVESAGGFVGFGISRTTHEFRSTGAYVDYRLPWWWRPGKWNFGMGLEFAVGWVGEEEVDAAVISAGLRLTLGRTGIPLYLDAGCAPTWLSDPEFPSRNLGGEFQFTTHIGIVWDINEHVGLGYRYQHISNGGIEPYNPGLNLHVVSISYRF